MGVSIGISKEFVQAAASRTTTRLLSALTGCAIIDFSEQLVVLLDQGVTGLELERPFIRRARLREIAFMFVSNGQVVVCRCVARIDLGRSFPAIDRLAPEPALRDRDAEFDLLLRIRSRVRLKRNGSERDEAGGPAGRRQCALEVASL